METVDIKTFKVNELNAMVGMPVPRLVVTLTKIWPIKHSPEGSAKKWTLQNGTLSDDTGDIKVTFWNRDMTDAKDCQIVIRAKKKLNGGWTAVTVKKDGDYPPSVHVDKDALVLPQDEEGDLTENDDKPSLPPQTAKQTPPTGFQTPKNHAPEPKLLTVQEYGALYAECLKEAVKMGVPTDQVGGTASTLFIECMKRGVKTPALVAPQNEMAEDDLKF